jgi:hypothetical protein
MTLDEDMAIQEEALLRVIRAIPESPTVDAIVFVAEHMNLSIRDAVYFAFLAGQEDYSKRTAQYNDEGLKIVFDTTRNVDERKAAILEMRSRVFGETAP